MLASAPFFLVPVRLCPSSKCPCSMCIHAKAKTINQQTSNGREIMQSAYERGIKQISIIDMASKETRKQETIEKPNKQESKQKVVSARDKCRFGSNVHNFIVLKHGRHTNKKDSCMDV